MPWSMGKSDPDRFLPIPSVPSPGQEEFTNPWCPYQPPSCVGVPQEDKPGSTVLILEMALGFVSAESQFT